MDFKSIKLSRPTGPVQYKSNLIVSVACIARLRYVIRVPDTLKTICEPGYDYSNQDKCDY